MLRIIGGFVSPTTGTVEIDGRDVTRIGPEQRPTNTVFQGYGLFPHMTVRQNVGYGLRLQKSRKARLTTVSRKRCVIPGLPISPTVP